MARRDLAGGAPLAPRPRPLVPRGAHGGRRLAPAGAGARPLARPARARLLYVYTYLAHVEAALAYNRLRGIDDAVTWATLADVGRNLAIDRRMDGQGWPIMAQWLTLHVRGAIFELGRLQYQRSRVVDPVARLLDLPPETRTLALHIQESGPLTPEACDASLAEARAFFDRHFPDEAHELVTCGSWLLDPQLAEYLPADSNMVRF